MVFLCIIFLSSVLMQHLFNLKAKLLYREIQYCCGSFNGLSLCFVCFIKTIFTMDCAKSYLHVKTRDIVKSGLFWNANWKTWHCQFMLASWAIIMSCEMPWMKIVIFIFNQWMILLRLSVKSLLKSGSEPLIERFRKLQE